MAYHYGKFTWFEHVSHDMAAAERFYAELFGWRIAPVPMGAQTYRMIQNGDQGIGGLRQAMPGMHPHWMSYLSVPDVDAAAAAATAAGAKVHMPPTDFPPAGRGAALADPQGAAFSIWKSSDGDREDLDPIPVGDWCWHELMTSDDQAALRFYESVFGFTHDSMDGLSGPYYLLTKGGVPRAGLMRSPSPGPTFWLPYVRVADCDAAMTRAQALGANSLMPPMEVKDVGRFTAFSDPAGAMFAVIQAVR